MIQNVDKNHSEVNHIVLDDSDWRVEAGEKGIFFCFSTAVTKDIVLSHFHPYELGIIMSCNSCRQRRIHGDGG